MESITKLGLDESASNLIPAGNIVVPTRMALGRTVINDVPIAINQDLKALIVDSAQIDRDYLYHFLLTKASYFESRGKGATVKGITLDVLKELEVPKPPLVEQRRIANILDKADAIRTKRREVLNLADEFLRSVFLDMFGDPVVNPKGWPMLPLRDCSERIQIGPFGTQLHQEDYIDGGVPIVNPTHIVDGKIRANNLLSISEQLHSKLPEYHLIEGDVIMGRRGEMGRCALVTEVESGFMCGTGSLFIRSDKTKVLPIYLTNVLSSNSAKSAFERASLGATMPNLNKGIVSDFEIGIPPIEHQEKFSNLVAINSRLNKKLVNATAEANVLFNSLQQRAFTGQL
jgi:type I restriction enzyme S subunit